MTADGRSLTVMMPKIVRKTLGLAEGGYSRISIENHTLALRGPGCDGGEVVVPLSMLGTFHADALNNLFLYVSSTRQNGILAVSTGPYTKAVIFKDGKVVFSGSTDASDRIGMILRRLGYASEEDIERVANDGDPRRIGVKLKSAGLITHEQLWEALNEQVTSICHSLVHFPVGTYFFLPNSVPEDAFSHFGIQANEVLFQGMIRFDEQNRRSALDPRALEQLSPLEVLAAMEEQGS